LIPRSSYIIIIVCEGCCSFASYSGYNQSTNTQSPGLDGFTASQSTNLACAFSNIAIGSRCLSAMAMTTTTTTTTTRTASSRSENGRGVVGSAASTRTRNDKKKKKAAAAVPPFRRTAPRSTSFGFASAFFVASLLLACCMSNAGNKGAGVGVVDAASSCDANTYYCPNCGGTNVTDCLQCDGYLNTDAEHGICFDRTLFDSHNDDPNNFSDHYHYLARDIIATFVWFVAAGVATACGVGGGGIYVPLGMILLGFAPKPSSGLSQASIFGASLGGLILNIRDLHPNTEIKDPGDSAGGGGERDENGDASGEDVAAAATADGTKTYTRPLIDYDMALFLAPMEMAGAVLGVLIQRVLPNWLYLTLAAVILGFTAYKTYRKWFSTRAAENAKAAAAAEAAPAAGGGTASEEEPAASADGAATSSSPLRKASLHTQHLRTAPNARKIDWLQPSEMYLYSSGDLNGDGEQENGRQRSICRGTYNGDDEADVLAEGQDEEGGQEVTRDGVEERDEEKKDQQADSPAGLVSSSEGGTDAEGADAAAPVDDQGKEGGAAAAAVAETAESLSTSSENLAERRREWLERDSRQYPREKLLALGLLWVGLILLTFMKGGKGVDSIVGITCASPWYGVLIAIQFLWTLGFALVSGIKLVKKQADKEACGYPFLENDVLWDMSKLRFYAFFTFVAGIVAGLIGIGGGMVLGPLMLVMGIHPRVSSATTGTMIVLTSSSVAVLFVTSGLVPWEYAVYFFCICFLGAYIGKRYIDGYVKRSGKASILIFLLATIIALATIGCVVIVLTRLADAGWCIDGFHKFCDAGTADGDVCPVDRLLLRAATMVGTEDALAVLKAS